MWWASITLSSWHASFAVRPARRRSRMRRSGWSRATATWAMARSPSCGGPHEHRDCRAAVARAPAADADARKPALLGRYARGAVHAPALRRVRQGAALSATGLPALLFDGEQLQGSADRRRYPYLDG